MMVNTTRSMFSAPGVMNSVNPTLQNNESRHRSTNQSLTLIGHHLVHPASCDGLDEAEVAPAQHLLLQSSRLVVVLRRPRQHLEDGEHQRHEDLLQEGRHLPLP